MSQIRGDILYQRRIKEVTQSDQQMRRLHIATPIVDDSNNFNEEEQNLDKEDLIVVSDDDDNADTNNNNKEKGETSQILKKMRINGMLSFLNGLKRPIMKIGLKIVMMNYCLMET
jgi:hypothetical protein